MTTYIKLSCCCGSDVGSAASQLLSEAVSERQEETHGQDPGAEPLSLFRLLLLLLQEQLLQKSSTWTASNENKAYVKSIAFDRAIC